MRSDSEIIARPSRWLPLLEAIGVFLLIMGYIWWLKFYFAPGWLLILAAVVGSHLYHRETPGELGFRLANLRRCFTEFALPLFLLVLALLTLGTLFNTMRSIPVQQAILVPILYWPWGLVQQYLLNGFFVNRFRAFCGSSGSNWVPLLAASFFASAHLPNPFLMSVTFIAGYLSARVYIEYGNLYFLGFAHGVVGSLLFLVVPDSISYKLRVGPMMGAG